MIRRTVHFTSQGSVCEAFLYEPQLPGRHPAVALAHGLGALKEMYLEPVAYAFAAAGVASLLFDYRHYGGSDGDPRCDLSPERQLEDYRNALTWLARQERIDGSRLGVWGTSLAGGHVIRLAAHDSRVRAAVSQVPAMDLRANAERVLPAEQFAGLREIIAADRMRRYPDEEPQYLPLSGPRGSLALQPDDETHAWLARAKESVAPRHENRITIASLERLLAYAPSAAAKHVVAPTLMVVANQDAWTPVDLVREAYDAIRAKKAWLGVSGGHYAVYDGASQEQAASAAADWFVEHLGGRRG